MGLPVPGLLPPQMPDVEIARCGVEVYIPRQRSCHRDDGSGAREKATVDDRGDAPREAAKVLDGPPAATVATFAGTVPPWARTAAAEPSILRTMRVVVGVVDARGRWWREQPKGCLDFRESMKLESGVRWGLAPVSWCFGVPCRWLVDVYGRLEAEGLGSGMRCYRPCYMITSTQSRGSCNLVFFLLFCTDSVSYII